MFTLAPDAAPDAPLPHASTPAVHYCLNWMHQNQHLSLLTPSEFEVRRDAAAMASYFNHPHNRAMLANQHEMSAADVVEHYHALVAAGGLAFFLHHDGKLIGDADFRHRQGRVAEFALVLGPTSLQGRGLGTSYARMLHALAFRHLGLEQLIVSILAENHASQRLFAKLGYRHDHSPPARAFADAPEDVIMSIDYDRFKIINPAAEAQLEAALMDAAPHAPAAKPA